MRASSSARPPGRAGGPAVPLPRRGDVDGTDSGAVATAALTALYSYDTTLDTGPADAARRALPWLSPSFARTVRTAPPVSPAGAEWESWASHRAVVVPRLLPGHDDRPADRGDTAYRQYVIRLSAVGRDGWRPPPSTVVAFAVLIRTDDDWALESVIPG